MAEGEDIACCSRKVPPEAKKVAVCCDKLGNGAGTPPEAACSSALTEFPRKLLELEPGPFQKQLTSIASRLTLPKLHLAKFKHYQFPLKIGLNLFKESRRTSPLRVRRWLWLYIYPRWPEVMVGCDRECRAYRNLTMTMAISPIKCFPWQLLE